MHKNNFVAALRHSNNLSRTSSFNFCQDRNIAGLTIKRLHSFRSDACLSSLWSKILIDVKYYNLNKTSLPRKLKRPARLQKKKKLIPMMKLGTLKRFATVYILILLTQ